MADDFADCPMAHMVTVEKIAEVRAQYEDLAVVCYVNSTAEIKSVSDVCVTSSNALRVVEKLPRRILFCTGENLGDMLRETSQKHFILIEGFCHRT